MTKTAIVSQVRMVMKNDLGEDFPSLFEEKLAAGLTARGVQVLIVAFDELGLDPTVVDQRLAQFGPSTVLFVRPVGSLRDGYGNVNAVRFDVSVGPPARSSARVWRASVELKGMGSAETKAATLARDIISKLMEDGLL